jgi:hypothetical protein
VDQPRFGTGGDCARAVGILRVAVGASALTVLAAAGSTTTAWPHAFAVGAAIHRAATVVVIAGHITARPPGCVPVGALAPIVNIPNSPPTSPVRTARGPTAELSPSLRLRRLVGAAA